MAASSELKAGHSLEWNTYFPYEGIDYESPVFTVRDIEHYFKFYRSGNSFCLALECCDGASSGRFSSFNVVVLSELKCGASSYLVYGPVTVPCCLSAANKRQFCSFPESAIKSKLGNDIRYRNIVRFLFIFERADEPKVPGSREKAEEESTRSDLARLQRDFDYLSHDFASLLDNEVNPDVQLKCEEGAVQAHRLVLSSRSKVFATMFQTDMKEKATGSVDMGHVDLQTLRLFLKYIYSGKIPDLPVEMASTLYALGDKYEVPALMAVCSDFMAKNVSEENYTEYLSLADSHGDDTFKQAVIAYIIDNPGLMKNDKWLKFSPEHMELALEVFQKYVDTLPAKN